MYDLLKVQALALVLGLVADVDAQTLVELLVHIAEDHGEVGLAAPQPAELLLSLGGGGVGQGADTQGDKRLVGVETGIFVA